MGSPIAHSLSPVLHRAAYAALGLDWRYDAIEVDEDGLPGFLDTLGPQWAGLSLTMPLKRAVLPLLDSASALVGLVGAANTVVLGRAGELVGHNTDVAGIVAALGGIGARPGPALVLGGGATARSALAAVHELGCSQVTVLARRPGVTRAELADLADRLGLRLAVAGWPASGQRLPDAGDAPVVVSTVPSGAAATLAPAVPVEPGALLDVSYAPWPPPLVGAWRAAGGPAASGEEMLLHQAVEQVVLMTGRRPPVPAMRAALQSELRHRGQQPAQ